MQLFDYMFPIQLTKNCLKRVTGGLQTSSRVEAESNTSTVALPVVEATKREVSNLGE
jgi:hypothetical protein